jgi:DNA-binding LytR/AlgR family response regulator
VQIRCLIVDDEPPARRVLEKYIDDIPTLKLEGKCHDAFDAIDLLHKKQIDLLFLDINMPKMTGLDFLKTLQNPPLVIITTAYREYAIEGFDLDVIDYLTKPIPFDRFLKAVNKAIDRFKAKSNLNTPNLILSGNMLELPDCIFVKVDKANYKINLDDILYIESVGDYVKIFTPEKTYLTNLTMKKIDAGLPSNRFMRVHKGYIISVSKISSLEGNIIKIYNMLIPIGQTYRKDFFRFIDSLNRN